MVAATQHKTADIDKLPGLGLKKRIREDAYAKIYSALSEGSDLVSALNRCALEEFELRHYHTSIYILKAMLDFLTTDTDHPEKDSILLDTIILFARLVDCHHSLYPTVKRYLELGLKISVCLNDLRRQILVILNLGLYYYSARYPKDGYRFFTRGLQMADKLGDRDILLRTQFYRGIFSLVRGRLQKAIGYFEHVLFHESPDFRVLPVYNAVLHLYFAYSHAGEYYQAINLLKSNIEHAEQADDYFSVRIYRIHLCWGFLMSGKLGEAEKILDTLDEDSQTQYGFTFLPIKHAKAYYWYLQKEYQKAYQLVTEAGLFMKQTDMRRITYPWFPELIFCFKDQGFDPIPGFDDFDTYIEDLISGHHLALRGIAWRIKAVEILQNSGNADNAWTYFENSQQDLKASGSRIELAKTRVEMAKFKLGTNNKKMAQQFAVLAWSAISVYENLPFPQELLPLMNIKPANDSSTFEQNLDFYLGFLEILNELVPNENREKFLIQLLSLMARFFSADSGCIYKFTASKNEPVFSNISYNLDAVKNSQELLDRLSLEARQTHLSQAPAISRFSGVNCCENPAQVTHNLFIPFRLKNEFTGVLYIGNVANSVIDQIDETVLLKLSKYLSRHVNNQWSLFCESKSDCRSAISRATNNLTVFDNPGSFYYGNQNQLSEQASRLAASDASILILGETGVGKNYLARLLHDFSNRKEMPFIYVNISGLSKNLIESELFGHEKGAFTGADKQKSGMIELANKGTLFIDEVGDIPKSIQVKLLRVLEEKTVVRVGGIIPREIDFRLIAATNHDLVKDVENGEFREDLYYRLSVVPMVVPPLRERKNEITKLVNKFLSYYAKKYRIAVPRLSSENKTALQQYYWPGNIRELKNVIEQAILLSNGHDLQFQIPRHPQANTPSKPRVKKTASFSGNPTLDDLQRQYIRHILAETGGQIGGKTGAAKILGMKRTTLYNRIKKLGIDLENIGPLQIRNTACHP